MNAPFLTTAEWGAMFTGQAAGRVPAYTATPERPAGLIDRVLAYLETRLCVFCRNAFTPRAGRHACDPCEAARVRSIGDTGEND